MDMTTFKRTLEKHGFAVSHFATAAEAATYLAEKIRGETVGFGGSITLQEMGLYDMLAKNNKMIWHWKDVADRERYAEFTTYITSVNGMAETGELVNIDGAGNRVSAALFGPKKLYFVAGSNKLRPTLAEAIDRTRNVASPLNAKRLNRATPCVKDGRCHDCSSPERICNGISINLRPMMGMEHTEVVLIDEEIGY